MPVPSTHTSPADGGPPAADGFRPISGGVELSFLSDDTQAVVAECTEDCKIDMKKAKMLRASADDEGNIDRYTVESIISGEDGEAKPKPKSVKISNDTYIKYFSEVVKAKEITETIEKALAFYFENMEEQPNDE